MSGMYYDSAPVTTYTNAMGAEVVLSHRASEALHGVRRSRFSCREQVSIRKRNCTTGRNVENLIGIKNAWTREVKFKTRDEITQQVGSHPSFVAEGCETSGRAEDDEKRFQRVFLLLSPTSELLACDTVMAVPRGEGELRPRQSSVQSK